MKPPFNRERSERGAVLVHVALALIALMACSTFVVDYGVLWSSRRQAQNAADAAALAGAIALSFDSQDTTTTGIPYLAAKKVVESHRVWGVAPAYEVLVGSSYCPPENPGICVRVNVYRDVTHGNALPTIFGRLVNLNSQDIRAMAIAKVLVANATDCLKPWGVIDKWAEHYPVNPAPYDENSVFQKYVTSGGSKGEIDPSIVPPDYYEAPTTSTVGTGFRPYNPDHSYSSDYGRIMKLKVGSNDLEYASGWFAPLALNDSSGGSDYNKNIKGCVGTTYKIGDTIEINTEPGEKVGPTRQGVETDADSLINKDPDADWDPSANGGRGGVINSDFAVSPRIVPVPLVDPDQMAYDQKNGRTEIRISNIMGFFVDHYDTSTKEVVGYLCTIPAFKWGTGTVPIMEDSGFMRAIVLVR